MKLSTKSPNFYSALFCVAFGLAVIAMAKGIDPASVYDPLGPAYYPMLLGFLIAVMGALLFLPAFKDKDDDDDEPKEAFSLARLIPLLGIIACCFFYVLVLESLGYVLTNFITITAFTVILGERKPIKIALFSLAVTLVLYALFKYLLGILLPPMPFLNI